MNSDFIYQKFLTNLEKKGYFNNLTPEQKEIKLQKAKEYFNVHYSNQSQFVQTKNEIKIDEEKIKQAEEHKTKGNEYLNKKDYAKAIEEYSKAIQLNENEIYYANRSSAYSSIGEYDLSIEDAKKSIQLNPNYAKGYSRLSVAYSKKKQFKEALESISL